MSDNENTTEKVASIQRLSQDDLKQFVLDCLANKIFTSAQVDDMNILGMIFMPLALGALANYTKDAIDDIGVIWEYTDKAGPSGINGYPIFFSCNVMHNESSYMLAVIEAIKPNHLCGGFLDESYWYKWSLENNRYEPILMPEAYVNVINWGIG